MIGINAQIRSTSGTAEGVGFAIPIDTVTARARPAAAERAGLVRVHRCHDAGRDPGPGAEVQFATRRGALVAKVEPDTPAAARGFGAARVRRSYNGLEVSLGGDLIVRIGNRPVASAQDVSRAVTRLAAGQRVAVTVLARRHHAPGRPGDACRAPGLIRRAGGAALDPGVRGAHEYDDPVRTEGR